MVFLNHVKREKVENFQILQIGRETLKGQFISSKIQYEMELHECLKAEAT